MKPKRVIFLMSDTGGGHRSAAEAIRVAMQRTCPGAYTFELVDVYRRYTPFPFRYMPEMYPRWVNGAGSSWAATYRFANAPGRADLSMALIKRLWGRGMRLMAKRHTGDVIVCVHALFSRPALRAYRQISRLRPPFVTVVTDLVSTHAFWYEPGVDRCLVPTQAAFDRGVQLGLRPEQLRLTGPPVHPDFLATHPSKTLIRRNLGLSPDRPVVLLVGGGDGMGEVDAIARAINARHLDIQLVIISGRNARLRRRLEATAWQQPTRILPFVRNMPDLMRTADILVTKAGPATISEAAVVGLPLILSGAVPGQEDGNVTLVAESGAGVYAPAADDVARVLAAWLSLGKQALVGRGQRARALISPDGIWDMAEEIHRQAQQGPVRVPLHGATWPRRPEICVAPEDGWVL